MNATIRKLSILLVVAAFGFGASACNTMHGIGKDTERAGEKIQKEADRDHDGDGERRRDHDQAPRSSR